MDRREGCKHTHIPFHSAISEFLNESRFEETRSPQRLHSNESSSTIAHGRVALTHAPTQGNHSSDSDEEMIVICQSDTLSGPPSVVTDDEVVDRRRAFPPTSDQTFSELRDLSIRCREVLFQLSAYGSVNNVDATETMVSLNIWAANMGVFREGRQSLAARLKNAPQIGWLVQQLLVALKHHLEKKVQEDDGEEEEDPSGSVSDDSSDRSSISSYELHSLSDDEEGLSPSENRRNTWASIQDIITSLRQLAFTIHLAGSQHRQGRILRFKSLERNRQVIGLFGFLARQHIDHKFPKAGEYLLKRVADSIATRRARFMYLELHQKKTSTLNEPAPVLGLAEHSAETERILPGTQSSEGQTFKYTLPQGEIRAMSLPPSVTLSKTLVTQLDEKLFDLATSNNKRAQSVTSVQISTENFPSRPKLDPGGFSFTCPYCFLVCPAKEISSQEEWMSHLIHDFEPFFCVFEECESPFACAGSQSGWLNHMRDKHTKPKWDCWHCQPFDSISFQTPQDLESHLSTQHEKEVAASLRPTLVKHSMISDQYVLDKCPFCGGFPEEIERVNPDRNSKEALEALQKHVRDHLISEALVLAPAQWEEPEGELDDTLSEPQAQIDKNSERDLEGVGDDYDMEGSNMSYDFKAKTSSSDWPPDPAHEQTESERQTETEDHTTLRHQLGSPTAEITNAEKVEENRGRKSPTYLLPRPTPKRRGRSADNRPAKNRVRGAEPSPGRDEIRSSSSNTAPKRSNRNTIMQGRKRHPVVVQQPTRGGAPKPKPVLPEQAKTGVEPLKNLTRNDLRRAVTSAAGMMETDPEKSSVAADTILGALLWDSIKKLDRCDDDVVLAKEYLIICFFNTGDFAKAEDFSRQVLTARMAKRPPDAELVRSARQKLIQVLIKIGNRFRINGKEQEAYQVIDEALDLAVMNMSTGNNPNSREDAKDVLSCSSELLNHRPNPPKERARLIRFKIMALQKTGDNESFDSLKRITLERHQLMRTYVLRLKDKAEGEKIYEETQRGIEAFQLASHQAKDAIPLAIETEAFWESLLSDAAKEETSKR